VFNFFKKRREEERQAFVEAMKELAQQNRDALDRGMEMLARIADVSGKQTEALTAYLNLFKSPEAPKSHTIRAEDEERAFLERSGFPVEGTAKEQMEWLLEQEE
jgi:uncharacterized protein YdaU (DUF1376 family)